VQHRPRRLVGADLQRPLEAERRDPVLLRGEQPTGREPHRQRRARAVEDRARRRRRARTAARAHPPPVTQPPAARPAALHAHEPRRPAQPLQVVQTVGVGREPGRELAHRPRVVDASTRSRGHKPSLLRLDGYPKGGNTNGTSPARAPSEPTPPTRAAPQRPAADARGPGGGARRAPAQTAGAMTSWPRRLPSGSGPPAAGLCRPPRTHGRVRNWEARHAADASTESLDAGLKLPAHARNRPTGRGETASSTAAFSPDAAVSRSAARASPPRPRQQRHRRTTRLRRSRNARAGRPSADRAACPQQRERAAAVLHRLAKRERQTVRPTLSELVPSERDSALRPRRSLLCGRSSSGQRGRAQNRTVSRTVVGRFVHRGFGSLSAAWWCWSGPRPRARPAHQPNEVLTAGRVREAPRARRLSPS